MQKRLTQQGFTLFEVILVLVLMGIFVSIAGSMILHAFKTNQDVRNAWDTLGKLRYTSERLAREVREVRRDPADLTAYDITTWTASTLTFDRYDGTAVTIDYTDADDKVEITYPSVTGTAQLLSDQVTSFTLSYLQSNRSDAATSTSDMAYVVVEMTLTDDGVNYQDQVGVNLRNRMGWY